MVTLLVSKHKYSDVHTGCKNPTPSSMTFYNLRCQMRLGPSWHWHWKSGNTLTGCRFITVLTLVEETWCSGTWGDHAHSTQPAMGSNSEPPKPTKISSLWWVFTMDRLSCTWTFCPFFSMIWLAFRLYLQPISAALFDLFSFILCHSETPAIILVSTMSLFITDRTIELWK